MWLKGIELAKTQRGEMCIKLYLGLQRTWNDNTSLLLFIHPIEKPILLQSEKLYKFAAVNGRDTYLCPISFGGLCHKALHFQANCVKNQVVIDAKFLQSRMTKYRHQVEEHKHSRGRVSHHALVHRSVSAPFVQSGLQVSQATYPLSCIEEPQHGALVQLTYTSAVVQEEGYQLLDGSMVKLQYTFPGLYEGCVVAPKTPLSHYIPSCLEYQEGIQQICLMCLPWVPSANTSTICRTSCPPHK